VRFLTGADQATPNQLVIEASARPVAQRGVPRSEGSRWPVASRRPP
jgi:hypothetical protein